MFAVHDVTNCMLVSDSKHNYRRYYRLSVYLSSINCTVSDITMAPGENRKLSARFVRVLVTVISLPPYR